MSKQRYSDKEIEVGLATYALVSGMREKGEAVLTEEGLTIPWETVRNWARRTHHERYEKIRVDLEDAVHTQLADDHAALAKTAMKLEDETLASLAVKIQSGELNGKELAAVLRAVAPATGIHSDKVLAFAGKPREIVQHNFVEITQIAAAQGVFIRPAGQALSEGKRDDKIKQLAAGED